VSAYTVIWLNEAHLFLSGPGDTGERVASGLRTLLDDPDRAPVLILGTLWQEHSNEITQTPLPNWPDLHSQARFILNNNQRISVAPSFNEQDLDAARVAAREDPKLSQALDGAQDGRITQYLAGVPELLDRFHNAAPPLKALITAAMDACRLAHSATLTTALLSAAAIGYLTEVELDALADNWVRTALLQLAVQSKGLRGPLAPARPTSSDCSAFVLADYLRQYGAEIRSTADVPETLWQALLDHGSPAEHMTSAEAAFRRGLLHLAFQFAAAAADAGETAGLVMAANLLRGAGRTNDAVTWYRRAARSGDVKAMLALTELLEDTNEELHWTRRAADAGNNKAASRIATMLSTVGDHEGAIVYYQLAAGGGNAYDAWKLSELFAAMGRNEEAAHWEQYAAQSEYCDMMDELRDKDDEDRHHLDWLSDMADSFAAVNAVDEALSFYEQSIVKEDEDIPYAGMYAASALIGASNLLRRTKGLEAALAWLWTCSKEGRRFAHSAAVRLLRESGRRPESDRLAHYGWKPDGTIGGPWCEAGYGAAPPPGRR
jgi:hypothetical protein